MFPNSEVEKKTTHRLMKKDIEAILLKEGGITPGIGVSFKWECTGGYDPYYDEGKSYSSYTQQDVYAVTITVTEKTKS